MDIINGSKNPILKSLKNGDAVLLVLETEQSLNKQIVRLKNIKYLPADEEFDYDWLLFDYDILFSNHIVDHAITNCLGIKEVIPDEHIISVASANIMFKVSDASVFQYCMPDNVTTKEEHEQYLKDIGHEKYIKDLQYYKDTTVGLWVTEKQIGDLLYLFWQRQSDACPLECAEAEKQEKEFKEWAKTISWQLH